MMTTPPADDQPNQQGLPDAPHGESAPQNPYGAPYGQPGAQQQSHPHPQQQYAQPGAQSTGLTSEETTWAVVAHISVLVATLISVGTVGWVVPLILYFAYKDKSPFIRQAAAGAFNFALMTLIVNVATAVIFTVGLLLGFLLIPLLLCALASLIWLGLFIAMIVIPILASLAANRGEAYRYPLTPTLLS